MNYSTKDLTSSARFDAAILSRGHDGASVTGAMPPDRRPPRRGGRPSSQTVSAAARPAGLARLAGARRGLVHSVRTLVAAALLALSGALALPATAEAQTETTLVSNIDQTAGTPMSTGRVSQNFTTGSDTFRYTITGIDVVSASSVRFGMQLCGTDASGDPDLDACLGLFEALLKFMWVRNWLKGLQEAQ